MASRALLLLGAPLNVSFLLFLWPKVHKISPKASAFAKAAGDRALITGNSPFGLAELALARPVPFSFLSSR